MNRFLALGVPMLVVLASFASFAMPPVQSREPGAIVGVTVVPHRIEENMRYRRKRDPSLAAKVQLFVQGAALPKSFNGKTPSELLASNDWARHDMVTAVQPRPQFYLQTTQTTSPIQKKTSLSSVHRELSSFLSSLLLGCESLLRYFASMPMEFTI